MQPEGFLWELEFYPTETAVISALSRRNQGENRVLQTNNDGLCRPSGGHHGNPGDATRRRPSNSPKQSAKTPCDALRALVFAQRVAAPRGIMRFEGARRVGHDSRAAIPWGYELRNLTGQILGSLILGCFPPCLWGVSPGAPVPANFLGKFRSAGMVMTAR